MSLDVYLYAATLHACSACGHVDELQVGEDQRCLYSANITHNLGAMAAAAGIYEALWRPAEMDPVLQAAIAEQTAVKNYHGPGGAYELEAAAPQVYARDLIAPLRAGLALLQADPARFEAFNAPNGWGLYKHFVPFVEAYLAACEENPSALVRVSR